MVTVGNNETTPSGLDSLLSEFTKASESQISETTSTHACGVYNSYILLGSDDSPYENIPWYYLVLHGIPWYYMVLHGIPWYYMANCGIPWYIFLFYHDLP